VDLLKSRFIQIVVLTLILLGCFGLLHTLFINPVHLIKQFVFIFILLGAFYLLYMFYMRKRLGGKEYISYMKAAKRSIRRYNERNHKQRSSKQLSAKKSLRTLQKRDKQPHLTVIEGKKGKKKNRAFF
jgi:amino acid permease